MEEIASSSMVKILVTGAKGQLGSELRLLAPEFPTLHFVFTDVEELNIVDNDAVTRFVNDVNPDFIINCAAYTAVDKAESDKDAAFKLNADAPLYLAQSGHGVNAKLIHVSTDYVFNGLACSPYAENAEPSPNSVYGESKLKGEQIALGIGNTMVVRTAWLYSEFGKNFVKTIASKSKETSSLRVVYDQVGSPTWANNLAQMLVDIVLKGKKCFIPEIFHYTNEGVCSWFDLATEIANFYTHSCEIIPILSSEYPTAAKRPPYSVLNKSKIKDCHGITIPHWRESLSNCLKRVKL